MAGVTAAPLKKFLDAVDNGHSRLLQWFNDNKGDSVGRVSTQRN